MTPHAINRMREMEKKSKSLFFLGLIAAGALTLTAFEWRTSAPIMDYVTLGEEPFMIIEPDLKAIQIEKTTKTITRKKKSSNGPIVIKDDSDPIVSTKVMDKLKPKDNTSLMVPSNHDNKRELKVPKVIKDETFGMSSLGVHELPFMFSCADTRTPEERFKCTEEKLRSTIVNSIRIPSTREIPELPGIFYVQFVIDDNGLISELEYSKKIPLALKKEVERVFASIPTMSPARVNGNPVKVRFAIPLHFKRM